MPIEADDHPLMTAAGYVFDKGRVSAPGAETHIRDESLVDKIEGRLNNVQYMAHAMDIFDIASSNVPPNGQGSLQFAHLMKQDGELVSVSYTHLTLPTKA